MKYTPLFVAAALVVSGCTVLPKPDQSSQLRRDKPALVQPGSSAYVADIAQQLTDSAGADSDSMVVGVTTLVGVTSDYNQSTPFAQTLSQQLMTELHRSGLQLMDFKTTDFIRVTADGDFALTRDYLEIQEILPITHVVVGTLANHRRGLMVSARLVNIQSKAVVSVAQSFIPELVVRQLQERHGQALIQKAP
ncbi:hypothetical protein LG288_02965 [Idiomarina seosinensis]|uniref:FlgO family outer membrane protein n=1 Tax=Idiomarina seosinensis TaxID=281739 RepID=UPI00384EF89D